MPEVDLVEFDTPTADAICHACDHRWDHHDHKRRWCARCDCQTWVAVPPEGAQAEVSDDADARKALLIAQVCVLKDRKSAIQSVIDERQAELRVLMKSCGDGRFASEHGTASFYTHTAYDVYDRAALADLFSAATLAEAFRPSAAFIKAAKKQKIAISRAVVDVPDERFKVSRPRTAEAKEMQNRIIEETRCDAEERVDRLAKIMLSDRKRNNQRKQAEG